MLITYARIYAGGPVQSPNSSSPSCTPLFLSQWKSKKPQSHFLSYPVGATNYAAIVDHLSAGLASKRGDGLVLGVQLRALRRVILRPLNSHQGAWSTSQRVIMCHQYINDVMRGNYLYEYTPRVRDIYAGRRL